MPRYHWSTAPAAAQCALSHIDARAGDRHAAYFGERLSLEGKMGDIGRFAQRGTGNGVGPPQKNSSACENF